MLELRMVAILKGAGSGWKGPGGGVWVVAGRGLGGCG